MRPRPISVSYTHLDVYKRQRNYRRITFSPDEMAKAFMDMRRAGVAEGLFLSSGIIGGGVRAQDKLLDTVEILRRKHHFGGYIHLKIMPGAERDQVYRAMQLADRLSVNLEGPTPARLALLAPKKQFVEELLTPLRWMEEIRRERPPHEGWQGRDVYKRQGSTRRAPCHTPDTPPAAGGSAPGRATDRPRPASARPARPAAGTTG